MSARAHLLAIAFLYLVGATAGGLGVARAEEQPAQGRHVAVSLIAETRSIVPGRPFHVALRQQIEAGWHTYWLNPGDSGLPTQIEWSLPGDFKAGPILWPQPERIAYGPVVDYGYYNDVLLPVDIDVPSTLSPGTNVVIAAHATWLVCSDACIPEEANLSISFPVAAESEPDRDWAERFASARAQLPLPNPFPTTASLNAESITLHIAMGNAEKLRDVMFFPIDRDVIDNDAPQSSVAEPGGLTLTLRRDVTGRAPARSTAYLSSTIRPRRQILVWKRSRSRAQSSLPRRAPSARSGSSGPCFSQPRAGCSSILCPVYYLSFR
jgi:thiol:disulfide interchange protein DsbD